MTKWPAIAAIFLFAGACGQPAAEPNAAAANEAGEAVPKLTLARLDCGTATIKDFDKFFSDRPGLYPKGPKEITDSCYLITHGDQHLLWDTGLGGGKPGGSFDAGDMVAHFDATLTDQLAKGGLKPGDIDIVGISHMHPDHTGQAAQFPNARLLVGKADFDQTAGKDDPFGPWRSAGGKVQPVTADTDVFGDGSVIALHLPGHTPDHMALLVKLASGPVLLTGDLYHSTMAREKRGVPPFNTGRDQTLKSMDAFETLAKKLGAKVVIQHEPDDVSKVPAFPQTAG